MQASFAGTLYGGSHPKLQDMGKVGDTQLNFVFKLEKKDV